IHARAPEFRDVEQRTGIAVEEYKRPEFEITLDAPQGAARYGQPMKVGGRVRYYFGGGVPEAAVRYRVIRRKWTPWWCSWVTSRSGYEIARGQARTDREGRFEVRFTPQPEPALRLGPRRDCGEPDVSDFTVAVEAHDVGGRTIEAEGSVRVGAEALLFAVE